MSSNVAIAAVSGGSAVLGGLIGAAAGHFTTIRSQKMQVDEERHKQRQTLYQELLAAVHEFMQAAGNFEPKTDPEWAAWFRDYERKHAAVLMLGAKNARAATMRMCDAIEKVLDSTSQADGDTTQERRRNAFLAHEDEVIDAYDAALAAMRADVGVER